MNFVVTHFNVDNNSEFPSSVLILENELHQIEVNTSPLGLVIAFTDSLGYTTEWFEDGKEWIDEDRNACDQPVEWEESFWDKVTKAEQLIQQLSSQVL